MRLKELRKSHDYTQAYVAQYIGFSRSAYTNMELGTREMTVETLVKLAALYDVSTDYLLGCEKKPTVQAGELPKAERDLLDLFHQLNADGQKALLDHADLLIAAGQFSPAENVRVG